MSHESLNFEREIDEQPSNWDVWPDSKQMQKSSCPILKLLVGVLQMIVLPFWGLLQWDIWVHFLLDVQTDETGGDAGVNLIGANVSSNINIGMFVSEAEDQKTVIFFEDYSHVILRFSGGPHIIPWSKVS